MPNTCTIKSMVKRFSGAHYVGVLADHGASHYAIKDDTRIAGPWEYGVKPRCLQEKG